MSMDVERLRSEHAEMLAVLIRLEAAGRIPKVSPLGKRARDIIAKAGTPQ
jgi:hypothetical protein